MARPRTYTDEQLAYIKQHWRKYPTKLVAEQLGMTVRRVDAIAHYHGLVKNINKSRQLLPEFVVYKINKRPQVIEVDMVDKDRVDFVVKTGHVLSGDIKVYGMASEPQAAPLYDHYQAVAAKYDALAPSKNWIQRLMSWLLTREA